MLEIYKKIWTLYNNHEKKKVFLLLIMMVIMAVLEVIGVGSIMPFLAVLGNYDIIHTNQYLSIVYNTFSFNTDKSFLIFLGMSSFAILFLSGIFKAITYYFIMYFSNMRRHSISQKLLKKYIRQPYSFFLTRNSSDISKIVLSETDILIGQIIMPSLHLIVNLILFIILLSVLIIVDFNLALMLFLVFGGFYLIIYQSIKKYLQRLGKDRLYYNAQRFKIASDVINGIKDLKILGKEMGYLESFTKPSEKFSQYSARYKTLSTTPGYFLEVIVFGAILFLSLYILDTREGNLGDILPVLGLYAMSAMKIKPIIHTIYSNIATMKFGEAGLNNVLDDLNIENNLEVVKPSEEKLSLMENIELKNLCFSYNSSNNYSLKNFNLKIKANTTVGIIGTTGAGKSTLVDIIIGLLNPSKGSISIDGNVLNGAIVRKWQNNIGYVPQSIFLVDGTIAANIAFGIKKEHIDYDLINKVSQMAQLDIFIDKLENKYNTIIGERGVRLSGGQRQRIGIARALYHNPDVLILDEATSALDNDTEKDVMKAINEMQGKKTIIMIAHRLSTIEKCDLVINLENGIIKE